MSSVRRSLLYSLADNYLGVVLQLASTLIISRLLTPVEIGIFAVAAVFAAMASTFRDFGVAEYLIQVKDLGHRQIQAAFAANLAISWSMGILLFVGSDAIADFYRQPGVAEVMRIQSINFLLIPFGAVTIAYFRRELNYRPIFIGGVFASTISFAVAVGGAYAGYGYVSLAWSSLAGVFVTVLVSILMRPRDFPRWPSLKGIGEVIQFGKHASGIYLVGQIGKSAPEAIIGRVMDMASVAFFSRAGGLIEIFNKSVLKAVTPVCLPYFAQATRAGEETRIGYVKATAMLTAIGWPFFMVIGYLAMSAVLVLYGSQWTAAVPLAQILCLAAMFELPYYLAGEVMIAVGRVDQSNRLQFLVQGARVVGLLLVIPFGLEGACWGLVGASIFGAVVSHLFLRRVISLRFSDMVRGCWPSLLIALACFAWVFGLDVLSGKVVDGHLVRLLAAGVLAAPLWILLLWVLRHPFGAELMVFWRSLMQRLGRRPTH